MTTEDAFCLDSEFSTTRLVVDSPQQSGQSSVSQFESRLFLPKIDGRQGEGGLRYQGYFKCGTPQKPLFTIITTVFNGSLHLERSIQSVINQQYDNIEYIVVDGGSSDGSVEIIKKYEHAIDLWVSERDAGIYDAMNKGVSLSSGDMISFINSDDWLEPDCLKHVAKHYDEKVDYVAGSINVIPGKGKKKARVSPVSIPAKLSSLKGMPFPHPALFVNRRVFSEIGLFDKRFRIAGDLEFVYRMLHAGFQGSHHEKVLANFRLEGVSNRFSSGNETRKVERMYGLPVLTAYYRQFHRIVRRVLKRITPPFQ